LDTEFTGQKKTFLADPVSDQSIILSARVRSGGETEARRHFRCFIPRAAPRDKPDKVCDFRAIVDHALHKEPGFD
jgi:hypothetical protein